jgi:hypothetical protein
MSRNKKPTNKVGKKLLQHGSYLGCYLNCDHRSLFTPATLNKIIIVRLVPSQQGYLIGTTIDKDLYFKN